MQSRASLTQMPPARQGLGSQRVAVFFSGAFPPGEQKHQGSPPSCTVSRGCIEGPRTSTSLPSVCPKKKHRSVLWEQGLDGGRAAGAPKELWALQGRLLTAPDTRGADRAPSGSKESHFAGNLPGTVNPCLLPAGRRPCGASPLCVHRLPEREVLPVPHASGRTFSSQSPCTPGAHPESPPSGGQACPVRVGYIETLFVS